MKVKREGEDSKVKREGEESKVKVKVKKEGEEGMEDFGYRNLIVWQKAKTLVKLVYAEVKNFPVEERYALGDQIRRAVVTIPSNIAEGNGRTSNKDYAHFLSIARGSLYETLTQLEIAKDLGLHQLRQKLNSWLWISGVY